MDKQLTKFSPQSLLMDSISWKKPVSWMLWISLNMLWEGSNELLFTVKRDAAILQLASYQAAISAQIRSTGARVNITWPLPFYAKSIE